MRQNKWLLMMTVGLLALMAMVIMAQAQDSVPTPTPVFNVVVADDVFLRSGPGQDYTPIGNLQRGDFLFPVSRDESGNWILVSYFRGSYGWIRRDLGFWTDDINGLPIIADNALTPTVEPGSETATPFFPTNTPTGNWVNSSSEVAYVRAGPGRGYLRLGQLFNGDSVTPVSISEDRFWVMIEWDAPDIPNATPRADTFGWVAFNLVDWSTDLGDLPVISTDNLTPSPTTEPSTTPTATNTPSITPTATATYTATATHTPTATMTATPTDEPTVTHTPTDEPTVTHTPTDEPTVTHTPTDEPTATHTPTDEPTATHTPTDEPTATHTPTDEPTATHTPTDEPTATHTPTDEPTAPHTPTDEPTQEAVAVATEETQIPAPTDTLAPVSASGELPTLRPPTDTPDPTREAVAVVPSPTLDVAVAPSDTPVDASNGLPMETWVGAIVLLVVLVYGGFYFRGASAVDRYKQGFVVDTCPVCQRGTLHVETRVNRLLGIPRVKRTVRCDDCRSLLREVGQERWRYAVDRLENSAIYDRYNGKIIDDAALQVLSAQGLPVTPPRPIDHESPEFIDNDDEGDNA